MIDCGERVISLITLILLETMRRILRLTGILKLFI